MMRAIITVHSGTNLQKLDSLPFIKDIKAWHEALKDYREKFDLVMFAVKSHKEKPNNFDIFREELSPIM